MPQPRRFKSCPPTLLQLLLFELPPTGSISTARSDLYFGRGSLFVTASAPQHGTKRYVFDLVPTAEITSRGTTSGGARAGDSEAEVETIMHLHYATIA